MTSLGYIKCRDVHFATLASGQANTPRKRVKESRRETIVKKLGDKDHPQDKCGVVYQLACQDCEASYIGETERALKQRLKEHLKPATGRTLRPCVSA